jgi:hypothetical protein
MTGPDIRRTKPMSRAKLIELLEVERLMLPSPPPPRHAGWRHGTPLPRHRHCDTEPCLDCADPRPPVPTVERIDPEVLRLAKFHWTAGQIAAVLRVPEAAVALVLDRREAA